MKFFGVFFLVAFCVFSHDFHGEAHLHYSLDKKSSNTWQLLKVATKNYSRVITEGKNTDSTSIVGTVEIVKEYQLIKEKIFFRVIKHEKNKTEILVYKTVFKGEKYWAWSIHNPFGLFDIETHWEEEPKDAPFSIEQLGFIANIVKGLIG